VMHTQKRNHPHRTPPRPDRIRTTGRGFAFIPNQFLQGGFFASLTDAERSLYLFLVLAGDRNGVSFYSYDRICAVLEVMLDDYIATRNSLIDKDLIAFDGTRFQVLSLPAKPFDRPSAPLTTGADFERDDPATIHQLIEESFNSR
jgi:hypothetical protein